MDDGFWTHDRTAKLRRLWAKGLSGTPIAKTLGCSRGAVMGKLHRLGLLGAMPAEELARRCGVANTAVWAALSVKERRAKIRKIRESVRERYAPKKVQTTQCPSQSPGNGSL